MARHKTPRRSLQLNLTPMMDLVFQLIVFFLLVTNFSAAQLPDLDPPEPEYSQAEGTLDRERLIVNVLPEGGTGEARGIYVGMQRLGPRDFERLRTILEQERERRGGGAEDAAGIEVDLRADASIEYRNVRPVMDAITEAGISRVNLVARDTYTGNASR